MIHGIGDPPPIQHESLTGSKWDGRTYTDSADHTCNNWTSNSTGSAQSAIPIESTMAPPGIRRTPRRGAGRLIWKAPAAPAFSTASHQLISNRQTLGRQCAPESREPPRAAFSQIGLDSADLHPVYSSIGGERAFSGVARSVNTTRPLWSIGESIAEIGSSHLAGASDDRQCPALAQPARDHRPHHLAPDWCGHHFFRRTSRVTSFSSSESARSRFRRASGLS